MAVAFTPSLTLSTVLFHSGAPFQIQVSEMQAASCKPQAASRKPLELRCSMAAFHLTLEENGRYLTLEVASLLQRQSVAGQAKFLDEI